MKEMVAAFSIALILTSMAVVCVQDKVTISGSSAAMPLVEACAEAFNDLQKDYFVTVVDGGTGPGIVGITERRYDLAMASRELEPEEIVLFGDNFQRFLIAHDGIAIAVSPPIYESGVQDLSTDQLRMIYSGEIDNWRDVGGPDRQIYVVGRELGSGTRDTFNEIVFGNTTVEAMGIDTVTMQSAETKTAIAGSDKGIGYLGFSYAEGEDIRILSLDGVTPTEDDINDGSYPLSNNLYLYSYGGPRPGAMSFIEFVQSPTGQAIAQENGFIPAFSASEVGDDVDDEDDDADKGSIEIENEILTVNETSAVDPKKQSGFEAAWVLGSILALLVFIGSRNKK
jgi:phosphate transport system substrate-binding protein